MSLYGEGVSTPFSMDTFPQGRAARSMTLPISLHPEEEAFLTLPDKGSIIPHITEEGAYEGHLPSTLHITARSLITAMLEEDTIIHADAHSLLILTLPQGREVRLEIQPADDIFLHAIILLEEDAQLKTIVRSVIRNVLDLDVKHIHTGPRSESDLNVRIVNTGRTIMQGLVKILPGSRESKGYQALDAYHLSGIVQSLPNLEIGDHEVQCTHGATTHSPEGEGVFYLQSRGLPKADAVLLDAESFLFEEVSSTLRETLTPILTETVHDWAKSKNS